MQHTPAPWHTEPHNEHRIYADGVDMPIGQAFDLYHDKAAANARLMALAPDLLTSLESLVFFLDIKKLRKIAKKTNMSIDLYEQAHAKAIAKIQQAKGEIK